MENYSYVQKEEIKQFAPHINDAKPELMKLTIDPKISKWILKYNTKAKPILTMDEVFNRSNMILRCLYPDDCSKYKVNIKEKGHFCIIYYTIPNEYELLPDGSQNVSVTLGEGPGICFDVTTGQILSYSCRGSDILRAYYNESYFNGIGSENDGIPPDIYEMMEQLLSNKI